jgi:hypothetical protein
MMFSDYNFSIGFSAPENPSITITDGKGTIKPAPSTVQVTSSGRRVSMTTGIMDLIGIPDGLGVLINW